MCDISFFFFFNDTATTEIYTLSLHDALPISQSHRTSVPGSSLPLPLVNQNLEVIAGSTTASKTSARGLDRKSTRLNSSHANISYAVFCLKKKKNIYGLTIINSNYINNFTQRL